MLGESDVRRRAKWRAIQVKGCQPDRGRRGITWASTFRTGHNLLLPDDLASAGVKALRAIFSWANEGSRNKEARGGQPNPPLLRTVNQPLSSLLKGRPE